VAQKVGEESFELVIDALSGSNEQFKEETADLLYHLLLLIKSKGEDLRAIEKVLATRNKS
jgi:phosphoribosyl-ATP pyrophosphohydrolase/phosphoribosyl-AMP cyclohydrolase